MLLYFSEEEGIQRYENYMEAIESLNKEAKSRNSTDLENILNYFSQIK